MDIDIDLKTDFDPKKYFNIIHASINEDGNLKKHLAGVYFQKIPIDLESNLAAIPYNKTEDLGYIKIDFLHLSLLNSFNNKEEIKKLLKLEPNWKLLEDKNIVSILFHIGNHFDIVNKIKPKSVIQLSDILALIRPGKKHLLDEYIKNPDNTRQELYTKRINSDMRKSHTIPYALLIILQMHLIEKKNENLT
jgi:hypothetical protein